MFKGIQTSDRVTQKSEMICTKMSRLKKQMISLKILSELKSSMVKQVQLSLRRPKLLTNNSSSEILKRSSS
jgi:vacuolar-type H+-ATPase subunit E/Vma4